MKDVSYRQALADLQAERAKLAADVERGQQRLAQIDAAIKILSVVIDDEPFEVGLAEACRRVLLTAYPSALTPVQVRDELKQIGYDTTKHTNIMASIHSVLKRLAESKDVQTLQVADGTSYRWAMSLANLGRMRPSGTISDALASAMKQLETLDSLVEKSPAALKKPSLTESLGLTPKKK